MTIGHTWTNDCSLAPKIVNATVSERESLFSKSAIKHTVWALDYSITNCGSYRIDDGKWRERLPHTAHLYPPKTAYWEDSVRTKRSVESAFVLFTGGETANLQALIRRPHHYARFEDPEERIGAMIIDAARDGDSRGDAAFWKAQAILIAIIETLLSAEHVADETYRAGETTAAPARSKTTRAVRTYLRAHLKERISLDDIAAGTHLSTSTISHIYKKECGETPMETLVTLRIERAKLLILRGEKLRAIADETGFLDEFHLSRSFKRSTGISPRDYVRRNFR